MNALLSEFILEARRKNATAVTLLYLGPANLLTQRLRAFGFIRRVNESGVRLYVDGDVPPDVDVLDPASWYLLSGDSDI